MNIFTKFHKDRTRIVDFLLIAKFWDCLLFHSPSSWWDLINCFLKIIISIVRIDGCLSKVKYRAKLKFYYNFFLLLQWWKVESTYFLYWCFDGIWSVSTTSEFTSWQREKTSQNSNIWKTWKTTTRNQLTIWSWIVNA